MSQTFSIELLTVESEDPCPLCTGVEIVTDMYNGEEICVGCGCVLNDTAINLGKNGHRYNVHDRYDPRRCGSGARPSVFDRGLNTFINGNKDATGSSLKGETIQHMRRLSAILKK